MKRQTLIITAAMLLLTGAVFAQSLDIAQLQARAEQGDRAAQCDLGVAYVNGTGVPQDFSLAAKWMRMSAEQGDSVGQYNFGMMALLGKGVPASDTEAAKWLRLSAEQGFARAQDELAVMYSNGTGLPQDDRAAVEWATMAAEQGYPKAQYHLGFFLCCKLPSTVPYDPVGASVWFELAAAAGDRKSPYFIDMLRSQMTATQLTEVERRVNQWQRDHPTREQH
jgi:hypothetical protein